MDDRRSWNHGYTFAGGAIAGLALSYRPWLIFAAGVVVGVVLTLGLRFGRSIGHELADLYRAWKQKRLLGTGPLPKRGPTGVRDLLPPAGDQVLRRAPLRSRALAVARQKSASASR
jgi:hypothetical protein